jgi:hypothetical protein
MSKKTKPSSEGEQQEGRPEEKNRPQDVQDPRVKNSRHKKVTADKWNQ